MFLPTIAALVRQSSAILYTRTCGSRRRPFCRMRALALIKNCCVSYCAHCMLMYEKRIRADSDNLPQTYLRKFFDMDNMALRLCFVATNTWRTPLLGLRLVSHRKSWNKKSGFGFAEVWGPCLTAIKKRWMLRAHHRYYYRYFTGRLKTRAFWAIETMFRVRGHARTS